MKCPHMTKFYCILLLPAPEGCRKVIFSVCVSPQGGTPSGLHLVGTPFSLHLGGTSIRPNGGTPSLDKGVLPYQAGYWMGVPPASTPPAPLSGWMGYPPPPPRTQGRTVSTCYTVGGMPLAFTQENFLVLIIVTSIIQSWYKYGYINHFVHCNHSRKSPVCGHAVMTDD